MSITEQDLRDRSEEVGECWIWQQGNGARGYPVIKPPGGLPTTVRRIAAALAGKPPAPRQPVLATCGERLCVNPAHMQPTTVANVGKQAAKRGGWKGIVRAANIARTKRAAPGAKLSDAQVVEIRASSEPETVLGLRYGVNRSYIGRIRRGLGRRDYRNPFAGLGAF